MAKWKGNKVNPADINNGNEYTGTDNLSLEAINSIVNNSIYASNISISGGDNKIYEDLTIQSIEWIEDANIPFNYSATITSINTISNTTQVELVNNQAIMFANYGFSILSINEQNIKVGAISKPNNDIILTIILTERG